MWIQLAENEYSWKFEEISHDFKHHDLATEQQQETWSSLNTDCKQGVSVCVYVQTWLASTKCKVMIATS